MDLPQRSAAQNHDCLTGTVVDSVRRMHHTRDGLSKCCYFIVDAIGYGVHPFLCGRAILGETSVAQNPICREIVTEAGLVVTAPITFSAALVRIAYHFLSYLQIFNVATYFDDFTRVLVAGYYRYSGRVLPGIKLQVRAAHSAGLHLDNYLVRMRSGQWNIFDHNL